jgi:bifunctional non-homologous end joining protein LigD
LGGCGRGKDRFPAIAAAAGRLKADSLTVDGEAVVIGPDGIARFDELRYGNTLALLYAFDLVELDGQDLRSLPLIERKAALARLLLLGLDQVQKPGGDRGSTEPERELE